ncbi:MAG: deaminase [archaeon]
MADKENKGNNYNLESNNYNLDSSNYSFNKKIFKLIEKEASKSRCLRSKIASVIVNKDNLIISKAVNGNSSKLPPCSKTGCAKDLYRPKVRKGQHNELCTGICAEQRAIINALIKKVNLNDATLYCNYSPCVSCLRMIIEVGGISKVIYKEEYNNNTLAKQIIKLGKIKLIKFVE